MKTLPLISCIMPTRNRRMFVGQAIAYFLRQDYPHKELIIVDDGEDEVGDLVPPDERIRYLYQTDRMSLGAKRNLACEHSQGEWIAHWDDDDWMGGDRLRHQMEPLLISNHWVSGACELLHYRVQEGEAWLYRYAGGLPHWVAGGTLIYRRLAWEQHPFQALQVGEDTVFIEQFSPEQVLVLPQLPSYIAILHGANTSAKNFMDTRWQPYPLNPLVGRLGDDLSFYVTLRQDWGKSPAPPPPGMTTYAQPQPARGSLPESLPLVSAIMPTYNRRQFVPQAIAYFHRQIYPHRELIIVDDGSESVADLVPVDPTIHYLRCSRRLSIGTKRNLACEIARGDFVIFWDDDDWYGAERIIHQISPLITNQADLSGLGNSPVLCLEDRQFWVCTSQVHERMFVGGVYGGTLAFRKAVWQQGERFPDASLAEDAAFLRAALGRGARLLKLPAQATFFYVRHTRNTWQFKVGEVIDCQGWHPCEIPDFIPEDDLSFYGFLPRKAVSKVSSPPNQLGRREHVQPSVSLLAVY